MFFTTSDAERLWENTPLGYQRPDRTVKLDRPDQPHRYRGPLRDYDSAASYVTLGFGLGRG